MRVLFLSTYEAKYPKVAKCLQKERGVLLTFYDFPAEHWIHLRTSNPFESAFAISRTRVASASAAKVQPTSARPRAGDFQVRRTAGHGEVSVPVESDDGSVWIGYAAACRMNFRLFRGFANRKLLRKPPACRHACRDEVRFGCSAVATIEST